MGGFHLFTLRNVPVWVSPWFFMIPLMAVPGRGMKYGLLYTLCIGAVILVHEFGHALVANRYKLGPQIMLHGFGGYTGHQRASTNAADAQIIAAGPFTGLAFGLLSAAVLFALLPSEMRSLESVYFVARAGLDLREGPLTIAVLGALAYFNVFWSVFNLLPMWPMDGGKLFRLGLLKVLKPQTAERITHGVSLVLIVCLGLLAYRYYSSSIFTLVIMGMLAYRNVQALSAGSSDEPVRRDNPHARELLNEAERAQERGDDDEAARLCHQIRAEGNVSPSVLSRTWAILGVVATRKGEFEEALSYLRRAPESPEVLEATAQCFYQLEMYDALKALTETKAFGRLPTQTRDQILLALRESHA